MLPSHRDVFGTAQPEHGDCPPLPIRPRPGDDVTNQSQLLSAMTLKVVGNGALVVGILVLWLSPIAARP